MLNNIIRNGIQRFKKNEESLIIEELVKLFKSGHLTLFTLQPYAKFEETEESCKAVIHGAVGIETTAYNKLKAQVETLQGKLDVAIEAFSKIELYFDCDFCKTSIKQSCDSHLEDRMRIARNALNKLKGNL